MHAVKQKTEPLNESELDVSSMVMAHMELATEKDLGENSVSSGVWQLYRDVHNTTAPL